MGSTKPPFDGKAMSKKKKEYRRKTYEFIKKTEKHEYPGKKKSISLQTFRLSERSVYEERENKEMKTSGKDVMLLEYICYNSASYY